MKRIFVFFVTCLLLVVLAVTNSNAQISLGAGFNWFNIVGTDEDGFWQDNIPRMGNQFVVVGEKAFNDAWAAHIGITYSMQYSLDFFDRLETGMEYLKIQPMVKFSGFPPDWMKRMYAKAGLYYGYATTGFIREYVEKTDTGVDFEERRLSPGKDNCIKKASDLGFATELGVQINKIRIGIFGQAGFINTSNVKNQQLKNWGLGFNVTYMFLNSKKNRDE